MKYPKVKDLVGGETSHLTSNLAGQRRRNGSSADDFPWGPPPYEGATNANVNYAGKSRVWAWRDKALPLHRVYVKEPGYLKYDLDVQYVELGPPIKMIKARVTETAKDGAKWGWPGEPVVRYEAEDGSWAWVPGNEKVGDVFEVEEAPARPGVEVNPARRQRSPRANPSGGDADAAIDKYEEFHRYGPRHVIELDDLKIPSRVRKLGAAKHVIYRSGKVDPETLRRPKKPVDYIHEHDAGVIAYACDGHADTDVPRSIRDAKALTVLGKCLGLALRDGEEVEGTHPLPDLCCTPDGKCLLVVQDRRRVLLMVWGGALGVFARGIDG